MLEELKKINQPGRKEDILFFLQMVIGKRQLLEKDIRAICVHTSGQYQLDVDSLLRYCSYLHLIVCSETIMLSSDAAIFLDSPEELNEYIIEKTISVLFESQTFEVDMFQYDVLKHYFTFKNERFPLSFASLRNTLVSQGFFQIVRYDKKTEFYIDRKYEKLISSFCKHRKRTIGIEQLKKKLEANSRAGEMAEKFVLQYEKERIKEQPLKERIRIISDIDVCAGYDIVSFNSKDSDDYDRFIEVKAISNHKIFYWSQNELDTARLKGEQYYIYLVDLQSISDKDYIPMIINDPANVLFNSDVWFIEPQTYKIQHL